MNGTPQWCTVHQLRWVGAQQQYCFSLSHYSFVTTTLIAFPNPFKFSIIFCSSSIPASKRNQTNSPMGRVAENQHLQKVVRKQLRRGTTERDYKTTHMNFHLPIGCPTLGESKLIPPRWGQTRPWPPRRPIWASQQFESIIQILQKFVGRV